MFKRLRVVAWVLTVVIVGLSLAAVTVAIGDLRQTSIASREDRADLRLQVGDLRVEAESNREAAEALADQVESLGEEPIVEPSTVPGAAASPPVFLRPTLAQLRIVLADLCDGDCKGEPGEDSDVPGPAGADSTVPGPAGPQGPPGPAGPGGRDAPRVTDIDCDGTTGVFMFDDGSAIRVESMCTTILAPPPAE